MKDRLLRVLRWLLHRLPEALLVFFVLSLAPLVVLGLAEGRRQLALFWGGPGRYWQSILGNPWPPAAVLTCLVGAGVLIVLLWLHWGRIWAVARKLILEAVHRRTVLVLLIFFVVLTLSLPFMLKTEGSLKSRVQLVMSYSLVLALVLLSLVAIFVSAASICSEIEHKHVHITDTKPLRRWQFLLGKWFGVVVMCMAILFVMSSAACVLVLYLARPPDVSKLTEREQRRVRRDYEELREEVLVARDSVPPNTPAGVREAAEKEMKELDERGELPEGQLSRGKLFENLLLKHTNIKMQVLPGGRHGWKFEGLRPERGGKLHVRFKAFTSTAKSELEGRWFVLKLREGEEGEPKPAAGQEAEKGGPGDADLEVVYAVLPSELGWYSAIRRQFMLPSSAISRDGALYLVYENLDNRASHAFDAGAMEVLQKGGEFLPNYYRAILVMFCHIALLAALGLMAGSIFSFPVASLTVAFFVVVGLVGVWFVSFLDPDPSLQQFTPTEELFQYIWRSIMRAFLAVMPHFGSFNPLGDLSDGRMVSWTFCAYSGAIMVFIKGAAALLIGMYFYARRELARVIV
ncbi:MAG: ABC transporter permease [Planctomycetota bacterium]|jgi:ABC-type transport system involved in multi-copper enzyme maturation permease subunit